MSLGRHEHSEPSSGAAPWGWARAGGAPAVGAVQERVLISIEPLGTADLRRTSHVRAVRARAHTIASPRCADKPRGHECVASVGGRPRRRKPLKSTIPLGLPHNQHHHVWARIERGVKCGVELSHVKGRPRLAGQCT